MTLRQAIEDILVKHTADLERMGGCGDSSCRFVRPKGMCTNGGCRCHRSDQRANLIAHMLFSMRVSLEAALLKDLGDGE